MMGLLGLFVFGSNPLQKSPSALRTSIEGSHLDLNPINVQLYGADAK